MIIASQNQVRKAYQESAFKHLDFKSLDSKSHLLAFTFTQVWFDMSSFDIRFRLLVTVNSVLK